MARQPLDDARQWLLAHVVESCFRLNLREREEYDDLVRELAAKEAQEMVTVLEQRGYDRGIERRIEQGEVAARRADTAKVPHTRFPEVHEHLGGPLASIDNLAELDRLFDLALTARTIDEVGLPQGNEDPS